MFVLYIIVLGGFIITAFVAAFGKVIFEWVLHIMVSRNIAAGNVAPLIPPPEMTTPHTNMERCFLRAMRATRGGVYVLGAPNGMGKSIIARGATHMFRQDNPHRPVFIVLWSSAVFKNRNLHGILGVPKDQSISQYVPAGTVIIIDQIDNKPDDFTPEMQTYVSDLAADSVNTSHLAPSFHLIFIVSNAQVFRTLMQMNAGHKILDVCHPKYVKWTSEMIKIVINNTFPGLPSNHVRYLFNELAIVASPRQIKLVLQMQERLGSPIQIRALHHFAQSSSALLMAQWAEFNEVCEDLYFQGTYIDLLDV